MKRLLLALLLLATPAAPASYWVAPDGVYGAAGLDSVANPKTLNWFNLNAVANDTCLMKNGTYNDDIRPRNSGVPAKYIVYVGNTAAPEGVVINSVTVDSTDGAHQCISIKGVYGTGDASFKNIVSTNPKPGIMPGYDSLTYSRFDGSLYIDGRSNVTVNNCRIGDGSAGDFFHYGAHATASKRMWPVDSLHIYDCTFDLATQGISSYASNAISSHSAARSTFERLRFSLEYKPGSFDCSVMTLYDQQNTTWRDCYFEGLNNSSYHDMYLLNLRDNQVGNVWERDTLVEADNSPRTLKVAFQTDGNYIDVNAGGSQVGSYDYGDSNNAFFDNFVKVRSFILIDSPFAKYNLQGNVLYGDYVKLGNANLRELTFRHNTVYARIFAVSPDSRPWSSTQIKQNIFAVRNPIACNGMIGFKYYDTRYSPGAFGASDSNLFWSPWGADSAKAIDMSPTNGGCSKVHYKLGQWTTTYGHDANSYWGSPQFPDSSFEGFNPAVSQLGLAISTNLWADGYAGAIPPAADVTTPVVAVSEPSGSRLWATGETMDIAWTSSDAVGIVSHSIQWGAGTSPTTWHTVTTGLASSATSYSWTIGSAFSAGYAVIRVQALDAAGNAGYGTKEFRCAVSEDDRVTETEVP